MVRIAALALCVAAALTPQSLTTLHSFTGTDGANPRGALIQAADGHLYGTTRNGGANKSGAIYKISANGEYTALYSFCALTLCGDGSQPVAPLLQTSDGQIYGTTYYGGASSSGTVFTITPGGALTTLHSFCSEGNSCPEGAFPLAGVIQASDGNLYGTTFFGPGGNLGTIFQITPAGTLTTLYKFCGGGVRCRQAGNPEQLLQGTDGNFYGTDYLGGSGGYGTVFRFSSGNTLDTVHHFCVGGVMGCPAGANPVVGMVEAVNGDFYGVSGGGASGEGMIFRINPNGTFVRLYSFCSQTGCADGAAPYAELVQATDGNLYGTTSQGGAHSGGTIFRITPEGALTSLYSFCAQSGCPEGSLPMTALVQDTDGELYGTTFYGGASGNGTVYRLSTGLPPFVRFQPTAATTSAAVNILGTNLTGATSVSFNGTPATFRVVSPTLIMTTVPSGATTGKIQVVMPKRTLSSNVPFRVLQ